MRQHRKLRHQLSAALPDKADQHLSAQEKKSLTLIQIGAFLEYFDLYLYVHMAVVLNEIFFQKRIPIRLL